MRRTALLLSIGLLAACSETSTSSGSEAAAATNESDAVASAETEGDGNAAPVDTSLPVSDAAGDPAGAEPQQASAPKGENGASPPLQRGVHVEDGTYCGQAANGTPMTERRIGSNTS